MADVRAMLRAERAARGATIKAKKPAPQVTPAPTSTATTGKKRKADGPPTEEVRKKSKAEDSTQTSEALPPNPVESDLKEEQATPAGLDNGGTASGAEKDVTAAGLNADQGVEDDEDFAAFLREMDEEPRASATTGGYGTISGKAMTTEELEAKQKDEGAARKSRREEDLEEVKDDAARVMVEEFSEVQEMETRVSRLREIREKARQRADGDEPRSEQAPTTGKREEEDNENDDEDEDEDEDEWDAWTFRPA